MVKRLLFALILGGSGIFLLVFLSRESSNGAQAIHDFLMREKARTADNSSGSRGDEAELRAVYKAFETVSIRNFQTQANSSCYWANIFHGGKSTEARFVLHHSDNGIKIAAVTLRRRCECPIDFDVPCHLIAD